MKPAFHMPRQLLASSMILTALTAGSMAADGQTQAAEKTDAVEETKTPLDQSNRPEDLKITQAIRKAVVADDSLSISAKNVRIITAEGKVTLAGPVNSAEEQDKITTYAKQSAEAAAQVVNQIEVKDAQP